MGPFWAQLGYGRTPTGAPRAHLWSDGAINAPHDGVGGSSFEYSLQTVLWRSVWCINERNMPWDHSPSPLIQGGHPLLIQQHIKEESTPHLSNTPRA